MIQAKPDLTIREQINTWKPLQYIDGDLVDGIINPNKNYIYWLGAKVLRMEDL